MMEIIKDTPTAEHEQPMHPQDAQQSGSGSAQSPGGSAAPAQSAQDMTHGQESYPGPRPGGETGKDDVASPPDAGDIDPDSTASSTATGQDGDPTDPDKNKANPWNG